MDPRTYESIADQILVLQCQAGYTAAFAKLFERYQGPARYYLGKMLGRFDGVEDLSQEVWLKAYRNLHTLRDPARFRSWLYRIARNEVLQLARRRELAQDVAEEIVAEAPSPVEPEEAYRPEDARRINQGLARISPIHRDVLVLHFLHDMTYEEIAETMDCPVGTVRSRLFHAKQALRREMEGLEDDAPE